MRFNRWADEIYKKPVAAAWWHNNGGLPSRNQMMRGQVVIVNALMLLMCWLPLLARSAPAHQHGIARLDLAFDKGLLSIELEAPLDALLGFERAPRNDAERKSVEHLSARLQKAETLFRIDPSSRCSSVSVELSSAVLKLGQTSAGERVPDGHADLTASYRFDCKGAKPTLVEVGLFEQFSRLERIQVQMLVGKRPVRSLMTRTSPRLKLEY